MSICSRLGQIARTCVRVLAGVTETLFLSYQWHKLRCEQHLPLHGFMVQRPDQRRQVLDDEMTRLCKLAQQLLQMFKG